MADMTGGTRRYHHGDLRRALLRAAEQELAERGPEGFTLRGCAKRAGVSHAAPTHHFGDARGLLSALAAEGYERFLETMRKRTTGLGDATPAARLIAAGVGYVGFARANPALFRLMFSSNRLDYQNPHLKSAAKAAFDDLVSSVAEMGGDNPLASREGQHRVAAVWAVAHGLADLILAGHLTFLTGQSETALERDLAAILDKALPSGEE